jgi:hypothetical protein
MQLARAVTRPTRSSTVHRREENTNKPFIQPRKTVSTTTKTTTITTTTPTTTEEPEAVEEEEENTGLQGLNQNLATDDENEDYSETDEDSTTTESEPQTPQKLDQVVTAVEYHITHEFLLGFIDSCR